MHKFFITNEHETLDSGMEETLETITEIWNDIQLSYWTGLTLWIDGEPVASN